MTIRTVSLSLIGALLVCNSSVASEQPSIDALNIIDAPIAQASRAIRSMVARPGSQFGVAHGLLSDITYRTANLIGHAAPELSITGAGATVTEAGDGFALGWYVRTQQTIDEEQAQALCDGLLDGIREGLGYAEDGAPNGQIVGEDGVAHGLVLATLVGALNQSIGSPRRAVALVQAVNIEAHSGLWAAVAYGDGGDENTVCVDALRVDD